jgi:hypothetical protein
MNGFPLITVLTFTPLVGGLLIIGLGDQRQQLARRLGLGFSLAALGLALPLWHGFDPARSGFQWPEQHQWVQTPNIDYFVGVDGLSLLMVMLAAIVTPMALVASWKIPQRAQSAHAVPANRLVRNVHRAQLLSLVHLLGTEPRPGIFPDQALGRADAHSGGHAVFRLHHGRERGHAARLSRHLFCDRHV